MQTFSINNFKPYEEPKLSFIESQRFKNVKYHSLTENKGLMSYHFQAIRALLEGRNRWTLILRNVYYIWLI